VDEIIYKWARRQNGTEDPWLAMKMEDSRKPSAVNLFRLANVVFSEGLREVVLQRGQSLSRADLDLHLKSDQKLFEKVAGEYNTHDVDEYDALQFPHFQQKISPHNFPDIFSPLEWTDVKKSFNQCVRELDRAINDMNVSGRNDPSDDEELKEEDFRLFAKHVYVEYWHCFAKQNDSLFQSMNIPLPEGGFKESTTPSSISSNISNKKREGH
jgi:hypothetical protein